LNWVSLLDIDKIFVGLRPEAPNSAAAAENNEKSLFQPKSAQFGAHDFAQNQLLRGQFRYSAEQRNFSGEQRNSFR
jgi:hypothetical protein